MNEGQMDDCRKAFEVEWDKYDGKLDFYHKEGAYHFFQTAWISRPSGGLVTRVPTIKDYHDSDWDPDETEAFGKAVWADREDEVTMADIAHAEGFYVGWKTALQLHAPVAEVPVGWVCQRILIQYKEQADALRADGYVVEPVYRRSNMAEVPNVDLSGVRKWDWNELDMVTGPGTSQYIRVSDLEKILTHTRPDIGAHVSINKRKMRIGILDTGKQTARFDSLALMTLGLLPETLDMFVEIESEMGKDKHDEF